MWFLFKMTKKRKKDYSRKKSLLDEKLEQLRATSKSSTGLGKRWRGRRKIGKKVWLGGGLMVMVLVLGLVFVFRDLPSPTRLKGQSFPVSTTIMDRNGEVLYEIYADRNRTPVDLDLLPEYVKQATIAIEDKNFENHFGFSVEGITRAIKNILFHDRLQGGSTITQQLVKTALLTPERTIQRKIREAVLTVGTEIIYNKHDILEMYLNHIPYGGTAWGIEAAAKTYFNKQASELSLAEATLLAGLPAAPSRFSPFGANPELAIARQHEVLRRMVEEGYIDEKRAEEAKAEKLNFATGSITIKAPHFSLLIKDLLSEKYGAQVVERGGLRVVTSLDLEIQQATEASLAAEIESLERYRVGNGAALVTKPNTGEILAMVGSKNYFDTDIDGQVNVTVRQRQPGSSIKPINYAIAMENRLITPATMLLDIPTCFQASGQKSYCPKNYDNSFRGPVQVRFALGNSYNIPAVKVLAMNQLETFIRMAKMMGISSYREPENYGLSLTLGGGEVTMVDMVTAFGTLANQGLRVDLQPILKVTDWQGNVLEEYDPGAMATQVKQMNTGEEGRVSENSLKTGVLSINPYKDLLNTLGVGVESEQATAEAPVAYRVLHRAPAYLVSHILLDNNARTAAFGPNSQLVIPNQVVSVKTGTTNNLRDNWTIGYTPEYLVAVWVGNNDNSPMNPYLVSGVTGAAPIFHDVMTFVLKDEEALWPEKPDDVVSREVCSVSGLVSNPDNPCATRNEFFWEGTQPGRFDESYREIWIKNETNLPPEPGDDEDLRLESHLVLSDPFTKDYCVDCAKPTNEEGRVVEPAKIVRLPFILLDNPLDGDVNN